MSDHDPICIGGVYSNRTYREIVLIVLEIRVDKDLNVPLLRVLEVQRSGHRSRPYVIHARGFTREFKLIGNASKLMRAYYEI